jgi:hypothetical protein
MLPATRVAAGPARTMNMCMTTPKAIVRQLLDCLCTMEQTLQYRIAQAYPRSSLLIAWEIGRSRYCSNGRVDSRTPYLQPVTMLRET